MRFPLLPLGAVLLLGTACAPAASSATAAPAPATMAAAPTGDVVVSSPWVASKSRKVFGLDTCPALQTIAPADRITFRTAVEAQAAGFSRAIQTDC